jgi:hypothetical protein
LRFARIKNYRFPHVLWHDGGESERHAFRKQSSTRWISSSPITVDSGDDSGIEDCWK